MSPEERERTHSYAQRCADHRWVTAGLVCPCGRSHGIVVVECGAWCIEYLTPEQRNAQRQAEGW